MLLLHGGETRPWFRENVDPGASMLPNARTAMLPGLNISALLNPPGRDRFGHRSVRRVTADWARKAFGAFDRATQAAQGVAWGV